MASKQRPVVLSAAEAASGRYSNCEIVLPLPGSSIIYPDNDTEQVPGHCSTALLILSVSDTRTLPVRAPEHSLLAGKICQHHALCRGHSILACCRCISALSVLHNWHLHLSPDFQPQTALQVTPLQPQRDLTPTQLMPQVYHRLAKEQGIDLQGPAPHAVKDFSLSQLPGAYRLDSRTSLRACHMLACHVLPAGHCAAS